jgi:hypothetical protein
MEGGPSSRQYRIFTQIPQGDGLSAYKKCNPGSTEQDQKCGVLQLFRFGKIAISYLTIQDKFSTERIDAISPAI